MGNFQAVFVDPGNFDFGELPENAVRGQLVFEDKSVSFDVLAVAGFQVADRYKWRNFQQELAYSLRNVLPTKRVTVQSGGLSVEVDLSKTMAAGGHFVFVDRELPQEVAGQISQSEEFKQVMKETLATLEQPSTPDDVTTLKAGPNPIPADIDPPQDGFSDDLVSRLARIDDMHREGIISDAEHRETRQRLLGEI